MFKYMSESNTPELNKYKYELSLKNLIYEKYFIAIQ